jgi:hypothetical protein
MMKTLEHPDITRTLRTGYPWQEEEYDQHDYEAYCDHCYEEQKEALIFGEH